MKFVANVPLFVQIKLYYQRLIDTGVLKAGEYMPSVREVSLLKGVNPNTVQKAFSLLTSEGYITPIMGKGNIINKIKKKKSREERLLQMLNEIKEAGFKKEDIIRVLEKTEDSL
ncbi:MAG TPA: GntR family transcriptional regulator [Erysipelotrichaceae bacterium]|nr:GntR family transcriptional regulator [Erysipelotrichaceae bacterium]